VVLGEFLSEDRSLVPREGQGEVSPSLSGSVLERHGQSVDKILASDTLQGKTHAVQQIPPHGVLSLPTLRYRHIQGVEDVWLRSHMASKPEPHERVGVYALKSSRGGQRRLVVSQQSDNVFVPCTRIA